MKKKLPVKNGHEILAKLREILGIDRTTVAEKLDVDYRYIWHCETVEAPKTIKKLNEYVRGLGGKLEVTIRKGNEAWRVRV